MAKEPKLRFTRGYTYRLPDGGTRYFASGRTADDLDEPTLAAARAAGVISDAAAPVMPETGPGADASPAHATPEAANALRAAGLTDGYSPASEEATRMTGPVTMAPTLAGRVRTPTPPSNVPVGMGTDNRKALQERGEGGEVEAAAEREGEAAAVDAPKTTKRR